MKTGAADGKAPAYITGSIDRFGVVKIPFTEKVKNKFIR